MLRACRLLREHYGLSEYNSHPVFKPRRRNGFLSRRWRAFRQQTLLRKTMSLCAYGAAGIGVYVALCASVHLLHQRTIAALFHPREDYLLDDWRDVEPTLKEGDIILMRGVGLLSWAIATAQLALGILHPAALRYSHVAVVVEPAIFEHENDTDTNTIGNTYNSYTNRKSDNNNDDVETRRATAHAEYHNEYALPASHGLTDTTHMRSPTASVQLNRSIHNAQQQQGSTQVAKVNSNTGDNKPRRVADLLREEASLMQKQHRMKRGAIILEAMDNLTCHVPDIHGKKRYNVVQRVEATRRLCSQDTQGNHAYVHFSVRRLRHLERSPQLVQQIRQFCEDNEGRPMDASIFYVLSFIHPKLYAFWRPERFAQREVSCSELIMELYQLIGLVRRRWRWVPLTAEETAAYERAQQQKQNNNNNTSSASSTANVTSNSAAAAAPLWPLPSPDDTTHGAGTMHVYENFYGRAELEAAHPLATRALPPVPDYATVEHGEEIADPLIRARSMWPLQMHMKLSHNEEDEQNVEEMVDAQDIPSDDFNENRPDNVEEGFLEKHYKKNNNRKECSGERRQPFSVASQLEVLNAPMLRAGDVARDTKGRLRQLRWYYRHYSLQTSPYQFTEGVDRTVIDWAPGCGLGQEIRMQIPNLHGPRVNADEDDEYGDDEAAPGARVV